jgi:hypothetical protein
MAGTGIFGRTDSGSFAGRVFRRMFLLQRAALDLPGVIF